MLLLRPDSCLFQSRIKAGTAAIIIYAMLYNPALGALNVFLKLSMLRILMIQSFNFDNCERLCFYSVFFFIFKIGKKITGSKISTPAAGFNNALIKNVVGLH